MLNRCGIQGHHVRFVTWVLMSGLILSFFTIQVPGFGPRSASAQEGDAKDAPADENPAPAAAPQPTERNLLVWMVDASGIFGLILLLLSFVMVALIVMNALQIRRDNFLPPAFIEGFEQQLGKKDYQGAYDAARGDDSFVARVLTAGLGKLGGGYKEALDGMQEAGEQEAMEMEHKLSFLALIGSIAPMIGLMGTVYGMIASFRVIANSETSPKPAQLAEGISTALFTTLEGLIVAIPAMVGYLVLRNRMARLTSEVGMVSEGLISPLNPAKKTSGPASTASSAPKKES